MKRAILVTAGTVAGAVAVLGYHPGSLFQASAAATTIQPAVANGTGATPGPAPTSGGSASSGAATSDAPAPQTYTGDAVQTRYGTTQVKITVSGSTITAVTAIAAPDGDPESSRISARAIPELQQQALSAQSASIDGVSGASYTSQGFAQSLQSALSQAGLA